MIRPRTERLGKRAAKVFAVTNVVSFFFLIFFRRRLSFSLFLSDRRHRSFDFFFGDFFVGQRHGAGVVRFPTSFRLALVSLSLSQCVWVWVFFFLGFYDDDGVR